MDSFASLTGGALVAGVLLAVMVGASVLGLMVAPALVEQSLFRPHWLIPKGEYATLVTSGFVHADLMHLLFNAFTFWAFAFGLERTIGSERFFWLYAFGLLVSDLGTWIRHHHKPEYRTLGASGAITAVLFAAIVYFPNGAIYILPIPVPIPSPLFALAYLAYTVFASRRPDGRINHDAHLSGAVAGLAFVALTDGAAFGRAWQQVLGSGVSGTCAARPRVRGAPAAARARR
jgi:membrane associated rhomboid family serine protease